MKGFLVLVLATCTTLHVPCQGQSTKSIQFQVIADSAYFIPSNRQEQKVALLDYHHNISGLYDGTTGDAFMFSYEQGTAVFIPGEASDKTWNAKQQSYEEYFQNPYPPSKLYSVGVQVGHEFDLAHVSEEMSEKIFGIFTPMSADYSSKCTAFAMALHISKITSDRFKTTLKNVEKAIGDIDVACRGDFKWLIGTVQGLGTYFAPFGGLDVVNQKQVRLDQKYFTLESGFHALSYLIEALSPYFDLGEITGQMMNDELDFFVLLNKLGGELEYNFDGLIYVLTEITKFNFDQRSKGDVKIALTNFVTEPRGDSTDVRTKWHSGLQVLKNTIEKFNLKESFKHLVQRLDDMIGGNWKQNGVDMSAIVNNLLEIDLPGKEEQADEIMKLLEKTENGMCKSQMI